MASLDCLELVVGRRPVGRRAFRRPSLAIGQIILGAWENSRVGRLLLVQGPVKYDFDIGAGFHQAETEAGRGRSYAILGHVDGGGAADFECVGIDLLDGNLKRGRVGVAGKFIVETG